MTCYEHLRNNDKDKKKVFDKLTNYFRAIDNDTVEEYHHKRGRK